MLSKTSSPILSSVIAAASVAAAAFIIASAPTTLPEQRTACPDIVSGKRPADMFDKVSCYMHSPVALKMY